MKASTTSWSVTSPTVTSIPCSSCTDRAVAGLRSQPTTVAPAAWKRRTEARPMPDPTPVISATLSCSSGARPVAIASSNAIGRTLPLEWLGAFYQRRGGTSRGRDPDGEGQAAVRRGEEASRATSRVARVSSSRRWAKRKAGAITVIAATTVSPSRSGAATQLTASWYSSTS